MAPKLVVGLYCEPQTNLPATVAVFCFSGCLAFWFPTLPQETFIIMATYDKSCNGHFVKTANPFRWEICFIRSDLIIPPFPTWAVGINVLVAFCLWCAVCSGPCYDTDSNACLRYMWEIKASPGQWCVIDMLYNKKTHLHWTLRSYCQHFIYVLWHTSSK